MPIDKAKLKAAFSIIEKNHGEGTVFRLGSNRRLNVSVIPTTVLAIDMIFGVGGFLRGRIMEIFGPPSGGKTTLCLQAIAEAQKLGGAAAFIDAEHALDPAYARKLGVDVDNLIVSQPDNGEQALEVAEELIKSEQFDIIIVDSVAALVPKKELEGQMGDAQMGSQARLMSQAMRKLNACVARTKTCLAFINQTRNKLGVMYGNPETTPGGDALKFYASMRVTVRPGQAIKQGDKQIGSENKIKVVKNKTAAPFKEAIVSQYFGYGFPAIENNLSVFVDLKVVEKKGSRYNFEGSEIANGEEATIEMLKFDTALYNRIYALAREAAFNPKSKVVTSPEAEQASEELPEDE